MTHRWANRLIIESLEFGGHLIPWDHPWDRELIYLHEWLIFMVNLGKSTGPMDGLVMVTSRNLWSCCKFILQLAGLGVCHPKRCI